MTIDVRRKPAVMIQGTGSHVGKSTIVAGLARAFTLRGLAVRPFKPQNMSNNAAAVADGGEIGRAQAVQARAAKIPPSVHMNPLLLKPETESGAQVIVQGRRVEHLRAADYRTRAQDFLPAVLESFAHLAADADLLLIEGAGSPAEINLREGDIAKLGFAEAADVPVIIVGDIDRGGVIASLVGTHAVLAPTERRRIKGFLVNKLRGDARLFDGGVTAIEKMTGWPCLGVVPWLAQSASLPVEDTVDLDRRTPGTGGRLRIAVPMLARIANFDDLDPLAQEEDVAVKFIRPGEALPGDTDLVVLPGSKSTIGDLHFLCAQGWDIDIVAHVRRGGQVLGLCGGYQMLGHIVADPDGVEGAPSEASGLGLLDVRTELTKEKVTRPVRAIHLATGEQISGYEIHLGRTEGRDCTRPVVLIDGRADGASSADGRVQGTYLHGLFASDGFRRAYLATFGAASRLAYEAHVVAALDALATHLATHIDLDRLLAIARAR